MDASRTHRRKAGPLGDVRDTLSPAAAGLVQQLRQGRERAGVSHAELATQVYSSKASISRWLSGAARPTRDQALRWAVFCGTDERAMAASWDLAEAEVLGSEAADPAVIDPKGDATTSRWRPARWLIVIAGLALIALIVATVMLSRSSGEADVSSDACDAVPPVSVSVPAQTRTTSVLTVHIRCPAPRGYGYILIVEVLDVGADHHPLYYPKEYLPPASPGEEFSFIHDATKSSVGVRRLIYVVKVTSATLRDWQNRIGHNIQPDPPDGAQVVSNQAPNIAIAR